MTRRLALTWLAMIALVALAADLIASDRAIVASVGGAWRWRPATPRAELAPRLGPDDWALWPPIAADPLAVRTDGALAPLAPPSARHRLGTDDRGRDVAARLIHGARTSATAAALATALATALALVLGLALARAGASTRAVGIAVVDAVASAPALLVALAAGALVGAHGAWALGLLIAVPRGADTARLVAAQLETELAAPYVEAARAIGASPSAILFRHALPAARAVVTTAAAITAATAVLSEAALSFLGLGPPPPTPSWGELLAQATQHELRWWLSVPAGATVTITAAALFALALAPSRASR
ncbi:MAG: ABC transporter permease subunit [Myxococcales bacterium]|nr:ABC transporter permease subunit [Myxococcales bacterium]